MQEPRGCSHSVDDGWCEALVFGVAEFEHVVALAADPWQALVVFPTGRPAAPRRAAVASRVMACRKSVLATSRRIRYSGPDQAAWHSFSQCPRRSNSSAAKVAVRSSTR